MSHSSSSSPVHLIPVDPRVYCETMNELHSYITSSKRGYLTQAELFRYYRQRHENAEIPYRLLGYRSLLDLLSSDQRLFAIDLRREPAYVYSAVKLRQEKRERRRGTTSFSRQHHSTNTLDDQHSTYPDYLFFDHHLPLDEQDQQDQQVEQENTLNRTNESPSICENSHQSNSNNWHPNEVNETISTIEKKLTNEEKNEETMKFVSNPFLPLGSLHLPSEMIDSSSFIQRKIPSNDDEKKNRSPIQETMANNSRLNRSISTSTTSLVKTCSFQLIDLYLFLCTLVASFVFLAVILYKVC